MTMATYNLFNNKDLSSFKPFGNNDSNDTLFNICLKNGLLITVLLIMSFIAFCSYSRILEINQLWVINLFLLLMGVYDSLEEYSPTGKSDSIDYFEGFKVGLYTSSIAVTLHAAFIFIITNFDATLLNTAKASYFYGYTSSLTAACITLFEGLAASLIITFCLMQYFKKNET
jgi:hypothetical protein